MKVDFYKSLSGMKDVDFSISDVQAVYYRPNGELVIRLNTSDGYIWTPEDEMVIHHPVDVDDDFLDEFKILDKRGCYPTCVIRRD